MKTTLLFFALMSAVIAQAQFNPPWNNDPAPVPLTYNTEDGAQYRHRTFNSPSNGEDIGYWIYLPPNYMLDSSVAYPIFYYLHGGATGGLNENSSSWISDDFIEEHSTFYANVRNSIVVYPNGLDFEFWTDRVDGSINIETSVMDELIPYIDANYNVSSDRACRGVFGFSMGGYASIKYVYRYSDYFSNAISIDGSIFPSLDHDPSYEFDPAFPWYFPVFGSDTNYFNSHSVYTAADEYYAAGAANPVNVMILAGSSEPLENYSATAFVDYMSATHSVDIPFIVNSTMAHDVTLFLNTYGDTIYSFQEEYLCQDLIGVGIEDESQTDFRVFPNPATGTFTVEFMNFHQKAGYLITDQLGKEILEGISYQSELQLNLATGVYFLSVSDEVGLRTKRLIVK